MKQLADPRFLNWIDRAAVVGLWEVVKSYGYFRKQFREVLAEIHGGKPDAVVLIDYPGFNLRLARELRRQPSARKIIYYISPQVWAWNRGRITQMARSLDLMLCIFPFEAELYNKSGLRTQFVGHPMIQNLGAHKIDIKRDPNLIGLFPGSRRREIRKIFPLLLKTAAEIMKHEPNTKFEIAAASPALAEEMQRMLTSSSTKDSFQLVTGEAALTMQRAFVGIVASGSATLEAAFFRMPFVLVYKVSWLTYLAARMVVKVKFLGMPNVLAGREIVPEFIQGGADPRSIAKAVLELRADPAARAGMVSEFETIIAGLGQGSASATAAKAIAEEIAVRST